MFTSKLMIDESHVCRCFHKYQYRSAVVQLTLSARRSLSFNKVLIFAKSSLANHSQELVLVLLPNKMFAYSTLCFVHCQPPSERWLRDTRSWGTAPDVKPLRTRPSTFPNSCFNLSGTYLLYNRRKLCTCSLSDIHILLTFQVQKYETLLNR